MINAQDICSDMSQMTKEQFSSTKAFILRDMPGAMTYEEYRESNRELHERDLTTGNIQNEQYLHYSILNEQRMRRLDKTVKLTEELKSIVRGLYDQKWLVITEAWCGDAAQNIPVLKKMSELNSKIDLKFILRDEHENIMQEHLTNGGKSIPKLIVTSPHGEVLFSWGPRPAPIQKMVLDYKTQEEPKPSYSDFLLKVQKWYNLDKTLTLQEELLSLFSDLN